MNIETFLQAARQPMRLIVRQEPVFVLIGTEWELRLLAEAYDTLGPAHLIVSDGLAFLVDRLLHDEEIESFVRVPDPGDDHGDVLIAQTLLVDLREGCALLARAIAEDQCSVVPRILEATADHASRACRRICRLR